MTLRKIYIGSVGALLFDDEDLINDADEDWDGEYQRALTTDSDIKVTGLAIAVTSITEDYTVLATDAIILADATAGNITVTLPTAVGIAGRVYIIKKTDTTSNKVIIEGNGVETINLELNQGLAFEGDAPQLASDNANWHFV